MQPTSAGPIERLLSRPQLLDPRSCVQDYLDEAAKAYWEEKDLALVATLSIAGIGYGFGIERDCAGSNSELVHDVLGTVKAIAYNLASFTWPGWDEPGIRIGVTDVDLGLDAAKINLRLAEQLGKGDLAVSRAHWMLGGHYLAARQFEEAGHCYAVAMNHASRAGEAAEQNLAVGFAILTALCATPDETLLKERLKGVQQSLSTQENGESFIKQIETAQRVFLGEGGDL
ncbi:hypothetical protein EON80_11300 [bacterium]|nr:MAG: hypothetical protein EON80_11300 [bacterium]